MLLGIFLVDPGLAEDRRIAEQLFQLKVSRLYLFELCKHDTIHLSAAGDRPRRRTIRLMPIRKECMTGPNSGM